MTDWRSRERLLRALERGGRAARRGERWGVWRCRDLRFACVGHLPDAVVAVLRQDGCLVEAPEGADRLAWNAPIKGVRAENQTADASPLDTVLAGIEDAGRRARVGVAAQRFHERVTAHALDNTDGAEISRLPEPARRLLTELILLEYSVGRIARRRGWDQADARDRLAGALDALLGEAEHSGHAAP